MACKRCFALYTESNLGEGSQGMTVACTILAAGLVNM